MGIGAKAMKIIVHGGMQKTGSSAIQDYLYGLRPELAEMGVNYPDFNHREHWLVTAAFVGKAENYHHVLRRYKGDDLQGAVSAARDRLREIVQRSTSPDDVLLLSHEDMSVAHTAGRMQAFFEEAAGGPVDITFVAYVRHPVSMLPSNIQQALKSYRNRSLLPSEWLNPHIRRARMLHDLLGDRLILRPFAPPEEKGWDVIEDFRAVCAMLIGRPLPDYVPEKSVNTSMSAQACAVLEMGRTIPGTQEACRMLPRIVRRFDAVHGGTKLSLPDGWATDIAAVNAKQWNPVVDLLQCSDEAKAALHLQPGKPSRRYHDADIHSWLISALDEEWVAALHAYCKNPENALARKSGAGAWVERNLLGQVEKIKAAA
jgi:hypothetical protein